MSKVALISGITGQDGSYLAEFLINKGYIVHGIIRRSSSFNTFRIDHLYKDSTILGKQLFLHYGDLTDSSNLNRLIDKIQPTEIYNLGAQSHVKVSFEVPEYTADVDGLGTLRILDAIRETGVKTKIYQASTSELFGKVQEIPQTEKTPFCPRSPYAAAKLYSYWILRNYREAYGLFAVNGILFNHESERRGKTFVTRKITVAVANIVLGNQSTLELGNLNSKRDWGYAPEFVDGMWRMLQTETPEDYVLATNTTHTIKEFVEQTFAWYGIAITWEGEGVSEKGRPLRSTTHNAMNDEIGNIVDKFLINNSDKPIVGVQPRYFRPTEVDLLIGDYSKAKEKLGWEPQITFEKLVKIMASSDFQKIKSRLKG